MAQNSDKPIEHKLESIVVNFRAFSPFLLPTNSLNLYGTRNHWNPVYKDLPHPPAGYLSLPNEISHPVKKEYQDVSYAFRPADGSNYNVLWPSLGKAGMPYARSVPSTHPLPRFALPDAGLVFDMLMKRDKFEPHPGTCTRHLKRHRFGGLR